MKFIGSICLSDIPTKEIKMVKCADGKERAFLSISIHENTEPKYNQSGKLISDHFISCAPKKEERTEGVNYIIGNLRTWAPQAEQPTPEQIAAAPSVDESGVYNLPWMGQDGQKDVY